MADGNDDTSVKDVNGPSTGKAKTCRFFQSKKSCKFGNECRFLHLEKFSNGSESVLHGADELFADRAGNQRGNEDQKQNIDNLKPHGDNNACNEPLGEGKEIEEREGSHSDRQGIVCKFFQRKRGCLRGEKCPFVHLIVEGQSALKKLASDKNHGSSSVTPRKQTTHQRKEIPRPKKHASNQQSESAKLQLENCDKQPTDQNYLLAQEDNATKMTISGQKSGVTPLTEDDATRHVEAGKGDPHCKLDNATNVVGTGTDGKGTAPPDKDKVTKHVKSGKGTSVISKRTQRMGKESATGIPLLKQYHETTGKGPETGQEVAVPNNEIKQREFEKGLPFLQKNNATSVVSRKITPLPDKENVRKYVETGKTMKHENNSATNFRGSFTLGDAILNEPKRLRATEIQQLKRRFGGKGGFSEIQENSSYKIKFKPTDPDWPFKIEAVFLTVCFPDDYPLHILNVALSEEQGLPRDIIDFITQRIQQWTLQQEQMGKNQATLKLYFRPFLRWFDKNLISLFIDGGKQIRAKYVSSITGVDDGACGVPSESLTSESQYSLPCSLPEQEHLQSTGHGDSNTVNDHELMKPTWIDKTSDTSPHRVVKEDSEGQGTWQKDTKASCCNIQELHSDSLRASASGIPDSCDHSNSLNADYFKQIMGTANSTNSDNCTQSFENEDPVASSQSCTDDNDAAALNTAERGTQIQFKGLNLEESISSIRGNKVVITLECNRCRQRIDQQLSTSGSIINQCTRCASAFAVTYRPAVIHHFSSILGYLDLDGCVPFDVVLPESELMLSCFQCSKETSVKGLQYGANWSWCGHCHQKLRFQIQSTRFNQLHSSAVPISKNIVSSISSKSKKQSQRSAVKEGQPLPANGTCKHYKKSFRWLRFPCCGKCYPCDLCHEVEEDHEMKYATRMVCGFCSREQPYSQQPCSGCKASITKTRSAHWEGGKGCRDTLSMSRNDDQKYRQLGKTVSRKAQKLNEGKGKGRKGK